MIINKKIKRTILLNKSQYLGSLILIILSCMLFTMFNQLSSNMDKMANAFENDYSQEDANFVTGDPINNIQELESKFNASIEEGANFDYAVTKDKTLRIFSENTKVNIPAIIEGNKISAGDILIDPGYAKANQLNIGDSFDIYDKSYKIAGFMSLPNYIYILKSENDIINDPNTFGIAVIGKDDFNQIGNGNSFYSVRFNENRDNISEQISAFRDYLRGNNIIISKWTDISYNNRVIYLTAKLDGIKKISSSLPIAILLLTCILIGIVIWRLLNLESAIIGTLYAQGYRKKEIKRHYLIYPLFIALTGGIIGTLFGSLLLKPMLNVMIAYFNIPVTIIDYNIKIIAISLLLPVVFLGISGYIVLKKALNNSPVDLIRGIRENKKVNFIERNFTLDRLKFKTKFRLREQLRSLSRLIFLLLGVILATMLLLYGFTAKSSLDYLMKDSFSDTFKFQYEYIFYGLHNEQIPENSTKFTASTFTLKSDGKTSINVCGIEPDTNYIVLKDKSGADLNKNQVIITKPLAKKLKVSPGDKIDIINKMDSRQYSVTVSSIASTYAGDYIFMPISELNNMLDFPKGSYIGLWSSSQLNIPESQLYSSSTVDESINAFNSMTQPIQTLIGAISFISFIIGLIVIYVVTSLIIEENKGNISLMKVFGYKKKEINSLILNSGTIVIVIGYILGIPLILASMNALFKSLTESINLTLPINISYLYILIGFVIVYLTYELSKALCKRKINRISMSEALKAGRE